MKWKILNKVTLNAIFKKQVIHFNVAYLLLKLFLK